jgi:HPt (histidine-containing phosphotransfer) domain-containing protein
VIPVFIARLPGHVARLRALVAARDAEGLKLLAHKLRGAGKSFGFEPITRYAAEIEEMLLAGRPVDEASERVEMLAAYMARVEGFGAG